MNSGGAENVLFRIVNSDKNNCHSIISLTHNDFFFNKYAKIGINVKVIFQNKFSLLSWPARLIFHIIKFKPDVVQTWMAKVGVDPFTVQIQTRERKRRSRARGAWR